MAIDYKQSGVDVEAGEALVDWLKANQPARWPHQERLVGGLGGFSALFRADFKDMSEPCLVSCTDGVGTKLKIASHFKSYKGVGQDLVAMCVNDLMCVGAQPLFFLDYYATGRLEARQAQEFLSGVQQACLDSELALVGGETAEMPGVYAPGDFDCAGFCVGVVDRPKALGTPRVQIGQELVAIASSGFHSNGFSLLRKVFAEDLEDWKKELLEPTALYVKLVKSLMNENLGLQALANITGGGLDNLLRILSPGMMAQIEPWPLPAAFLEVKKRAELNWSSLLKTLNCGLGMIAVLEAGSSAKAIAKSKELGYEAFFLGQIESAANSSAPPQWNLNEADMQERQVKRQTGDKG